MFKLLTNYSPDDSPGIGDVDDIVSYLDADDEDDDKLSIPDKKTDKTKAKSSKDSPSKESDENEDDDEDDEEEETLEDELEDELEEPSEEKLELVTPVRRKEILAKYPSIFKDFPYLEKAYFREQQFTKVFPTIDDAKDASEAVAALNNLQEDVNKGDLSKIFETMVEDSPEGFAQFIDDFFPTLLKINEKAAHHLMGNTIKQTIEAMVSEAQSSKNEALQAAAHLLNQFVFGTKGYTPIQRLSSPENSKLKDERQKVSEERKQWIQEQFTDAKTTLDGRVNNTIRSYLDTNIDPQESMTSFAKKHAINDAIKEVESKIASDTRFKLIIDRLWEAAFRNKFSKESTNKIRETYISKARTLLPSVIKKARKEALEGMGKRTKIDDNPDVEQTSKKSKPESSRSDKRDRNTSKSSVPKGMSNLDFMMED